MISKYALAKEVIAEMAGDDLEVDRVIALQSSVLAELVQALVSVKGAPAVVDLLKYELECLGVGGVYEIQRGSGHS